MDEWGCLARISVTSKGCRYRAGERRPNEHWSLGNRQWRMKPRLHGPPVRRTLGRRLELEPVDAEVMQCGAFKQRGRVEPQRLTETNCGSSVLWRSRPGLEGPRSSSRPACGVNSVPANRLQNGPDELGQVSDHISKSKLLRIQVASAEERSPLGILADH